MVFSDVFESTVLYTKCTQFNKGNKLTISILQGEQDPPGGCSLLDGLVLGLANLAGRDSLDLFPTLAMEAYQLLSSL